MQQHLAILGLSTSASKSELEKAYRREMFKWHPDRHIGDPRKEVEARKRATQINLAFELLSEHLEEHGHIAAADEAPGDTSRSDRPRHTYQGESFTTGFPDPDVFEVFVKSSAFVSIGYARSQRILYVKFQQRGSPDCVYRYFGVPEEVFNAFMEAESKGRYAHRAIFGRYRYERCAV